MKQPCTNRIKLCPDSHDKFVSKKLLNKGKCCTVLTCYTLGYHGHQRTHQTIRERIILINGHVSLFNNIKLLHESMLKSTNLLNIACLQIRPHRFGLLKLTQTHNHGLLNAINHSSHYFPIIDFPTFDCSSITTINLESRWIK